HGGATEMMFRGRRNEPTVKYPDLGAVLARELGRADSQVPDYVAFYTATEGRTAGSSGFLGARFAPMELYKGMIPENLKAPDGISELDQVGRADLREFVSRNFA